MDTIYNALKAAGCEIDNYESDLYVRATETARAIVADWVESGRVKTVSNFRCRRTGTEWIDIPFAYDPFWHDKAAMRAA